MNWLRVYLLHRAKKHNDKVLLDILDKPWDGKLERLPHFRHCQVFRAYHGIGQMKCTCDISTLLGHQKGQLFRFVLRRSSSYAKSLRRSVHPVQCWRKSREDKSILSFFRELRGQVALGRREASALFYLDCLKPNHQSERETASRLETSQAKDGGCQKHDLNGA